MLPLQKKRIMLYPLKFQTIYKEKIWGGQKINTFLGKNFSPLANCGESWEISGLPEESSVITNGFLAGNTLNELIEIYMGDLVGEKIYDKFGNEFPLLIKFIDAQDDLSVQVHPDDFYAQKHLLPSGKTEMWYIIDTEKDTKINIGFNRTMNLPLLENLLQKNQIASALNFLPIQAGDAFYIPAGKVHAICKGTLLAEIQQSSDTTFRLYDYNRKDKTGQTRPLHIEEACQAIHFDDNNNQPIDYQKQKNKSVNLVNSIYFATNIVEFDQPVEKIYADVDSFVIYICIEGSAKINSDHGEEFISQGECVLMPASIEETILIPNDNCKLLEVYIP